jgi:hypothetical protein
LKKRMEIPESGTRAKHVLAQSTHNTVGACAVLEDSHRSCFRLADMTQSFTSFWFYMRHTDNEAHDSTDSCSLGVALAAALVVGVEVSSWTRPSTGHVLDPIIAPIFTNPLSAHLVSLSKSERLQAVVQLTTYSCRRSRDRQGPLREELQQRAFWMIN